jgi:hypothetical protein
VSKVRPDRKARLAGSYVDETNASAPDVWRRELTMPTLAPELTDEILAEWLRSTDEPDPVDDPAGPLFTSGRYAMSEITMTGNNTNTEGFTCGTACTFSLQPCCVVCC